MSQFEKASNVHALRLPESVLKRWQTEGKASNQASDVMYICDVCGVIVPTVYANAYVRRPCACERAERDTEQMQQITLARKQHEQIQRCKQIARCYSWLPADMCGRLARRTFADFEVYAQLEAYEVAREFVDTRRGNLLMYGSCGTGKTHLAAAICNELGNRSVPCRFMTGQGLFDSIQLCIDEDKGYQHLLDEASRAPVLVIDDLDKIHLPRSTEGKFQVNTLFSIINKRYLQELPTLITTNAEDITPYIGDSAFSRLKEGPLVLVPMYGEDYRDRAMLLQGGM